MRNNTVKAAFVAAGVLCSVGGAKADLNINGATGLFLNPTAEVVQKGQPRIQVMVAIGIILFTAFVVALLLPNTSGAWIFHIILIAVGLSSCCLWPATIPLMIAWLKPETQRWFGRATPGNQSHDPGAPPPPIPTA